MGRGYVPPMVTQLETSLGRSVTLTNVSIGGTFSHFGLWQLLSKKPHVGADVIIVEYALNDAELAAYGMTRNWSMAYEGLLVRLRQDAPDAQIICPMLVNRARSESSGLAPFNAAVMFINARYDVATIDVNREIAAKGPADFWPARREWYADVSHYARAYQVMIAEMVTKAVCAGAGRCRLRHVLPVTDDHFGAVKSAVAEGIFDGLMPAEAPVKLFENSLVRETARVVAAGSSVEMDVTGEVVAVILVSTRADGVVAYHHDGAVAHAGLYRKAFSDPKFRFLMNTLLPEQYFRRPLGVTQSPTRARIEVLDAAAIAALPERGVVTRPSAMLPPATNGPMSLAVVDILYLGTLSKPGA